MPITHNITATGTHQIVTNHQCSELVGYRSIAKLKINGIWFLGFTSYYKEECLLNTDKHLDRIISMI
jgi:hypothetical protein